MNRHQRRAATKSAKIPARSRTGTPVTPAALYELGFKLIQMGQAAEAEVCAQQALKQEADNADAMHLMGIVAFQRQQYDKAIEWISNALRKEPKPEYLLSLGNALQLADRLEDALKVYDRGALLKPEDAEFYKSMGYVLTKLDRDDEAVLAFEHALKLNPRHLDAINLCAQLLFDLKRYDEAIPYYNLSDEIEPGRMALYKTRGLCFARAGRFEEAIVDYNRALELDPGHAESHLNLGAALLRFHRYDEALACFDRSLALKSNVATAMSNKAFVLAEQHRFDEAFALYEKALAIEPENALALWNLALYKLLTGDFAAGWAGREARWPAEVLTERKFDQPLWLGDGSIAGKTILLHADEGIGDTIQFARYAPMVAALGARVVLEVPGAIHTLLSKTPGVWGDLPRGFPMMPQFDVHCPLSSLPLAFGTRLETIPPSVVPTVPPDRRAEWRGRLGSHRRARVGLVWSGNSTHKNDHNRSMALQALAPLLDLDATFVSLQKDPREQDTAFLHDCTEIVDMREHLADFVETAALVSCLDLVITVDTSVAHLAGSLGRPVWIMLPFTPDYRWLLDREDSPWYPTARLFRQDETRDYAPVVDRIRAELQDLIGSWQPPAAEADDVSFIPSASPSKPMPAAPSGLSSSGEPALSNLAAFLRTARVTSPD